MPDFPSKDISVDDLREKIKLLHKSTTTQPIKIHFVVKIQVPVLEVNNCQQLGVFVEDKSFQVILEKKKNREVFSELFKKIYSDGVGGLKGYFQAIIATDKRCIKINVKRMLPSQPW